MTESTVEIKNKKKPDINLLLPKSLLSGLKRSPTNPTLRAAAMSRFGVGIPDTKKTFKAIEEWVAENVELANTKPPPPDNLDAFTIEVSMGERRYGTANYSCHASGSNDYCISTVFMDQIADELRSGLDFNEAISRCREELRELAMDDPPEMEDGDYDYNDHEFGDSENTSVDFNNSTLMRRVREYLALYHPDISLPPPTL